MNSNRGDGAKGKHGWGGARPGAGRPRKPPQLATIAAADDPMVFLLSVMDADAVDMRLRADAARVLMPYFHERKADTGKKAQRHEAAKKVAKRFNVSTPPRVLKFPRRD